MIVLVLRVFEYTFKITVVKSKQHKLKTDHCGDTIRTILNRNAVEIKGKRKKNCILKSIFLFL